MDEEIRRDLERRISEGPPTEHGQWKPNTDVIIRFAGPEGIEVGEFETTLTDIIDDS